MNRGKAGTPFGLGWASQPSALPIPGTVTTAVVVAFQRTIARLSSISNTSGLPRNVLGRATVALPKKADSKKNSGYSTVGYYRVANLSSTWGQCTANAGFAPAFNLLFGGGGGTRGHFEAISMDSQRHRTESMMPRKRQCPLIPVGARMQQS